MEDIGRPPGEPPDAYVYCCVCGERGRIDGAEGCTYCGGYACPDHIIDEGTYAICDDCRSQGLDTEEMAGGELTVYLQMPNGMHLGLLDEGKLGDMLNALEFMYQFSADARPDVMAISQELFRWRAANWDEQDQADDIDGAEFVEVRRLYNWPYPMLEMAWFASRKDWDTVLDAHRGDAIHCRVCGGFLHPKGGPLGCPECGRPLTATERLDSETLNIYYTPDGPVFDMQQIAAKIGKYLHPTAARCFECEHGYYYDRKAKVWRDEYSKLAIALFPIPSEHTAVECEGSDSCAQPCVGNCEDCPYDEEVKSD